MKLKEAAKKVEDGIEETLTYWNMVSFFIELTSHQLKRMLFGPTDIGPDTCWFYSQFLRQLTARHIILV